MAASAGAQPGHSLAGIEIFKDIEPEARKRIEQRCRWRKYQPHDAIIERPSSGNDVHFIASGKVRVVNYAASGREVSFDDIPEGGCFGELAAIDGGERSAYVVALQPTVTASLDPRTFLNVLSDHPEISKAMMQRLCRMVRNSSERIMDLSTLGAHNRVHAEVLRLARAVEKPDNSARISPIPVHADVASRVSTTRETVARVFSELTRKGLLRKDRNALVVPDVHAIEELVAKVREE